MPKAPESNLVAKIIKAGNLSGELRKELSELAYCGSELKDDDLVIFYWSPFSSHAEVEKIKGDSPIEYLQAIVLR